MSFTHKETFQIHPQSQIAGDILKKFNVEPYPKNETIEQIMRRMTKDPSLENEAFFIINLGTLVRKYQEWMKELPRVKPFYAIKCNPNPALVRTLAALGVNFDCSSKSEIQQVLGCGIAASRIIYANPTKMVAHIKFAKSSGVDVMTFDNAAELQKISEHHRSSRLVLRIVVDDSNLQSPAESKFGALMDDVPDLLKLAKTLDLNVVGVSFHVGFGRQSAESFVSGIQSARQVFDIAEELGFQLKLLDLGGGWPGSDSDRIKFTDIAQQIRPLIDELFPSDIEVISEPGRFFVAESHTLIVNVFAKRQAITPEGSKELLYYINDGVYQSFNCILFDNAMPPMTVLNPGDRHLKHRCTIFGPTCDSLDCIARDIDVIELEVGDWLYFKDMGAYTTAASSPFNGFKSSQCFYFYD
eukprot:TRINITY_DN1853_c0_g1_i1.p1 TRINITY_DN1853_c0_g1~~TRINITY_DN1853_c0_g1_i1.p1  ORF type:complete len:413 (+),score=104.09 TRINITY_DN1853_c0_g1_i1:221-1459(+)